jgi:glyceraldehyde-3-phosphate dehydrogenase (NADP+)
MKQGSPLEKDTYISAMIDEDNAIRVESWVNEAVTQGAKLLYGGKRSGSYIEPTVLTNTKNNMKVQCMEVFGPVVNIEPFTSLDEVVKEINNSDFGLQAGIFTNDISDMDFAFNNLEVGGVIVNDVPTFRVDHMPYGGVKDSGLGREGIKYAIAEVMEPRILVK